LTLARRRLAAHLLTGMSLALDGLGLVLLVPQLSGSSFERLDAQTIGGYVLGATFPVVGWLVATRRPGNAIGWVFIGVGLSQALDSFAGQYGVIGLVTAPGSLPAADILAWIATWAWAPGFTLLLTFGVLLFPDGRPPSPRWRPVLWTAAVALVLLIVPVAMVAWPDRGPDLLGVGPVQSSDPTVQALLSVQFLGLILLAVSALLSVAGLVVRFRRSVGVERAQLKWFVAAGAVEVVSLVASAFVTIPSPLLNVVLTLAVSPLLPIAATIAILRYRLYDIDRIVSRSVSYAVVTGLLAALFATLVVALQEVVAPFTRNSSIAVAGSTLVVAATFQPLRTRVQRLVNRRFNRARFDADRVASGFARLIRDQAEAGSVIDALDVAIRGTVQPRSAAVWIRRNTQ
jgi:hypothetical protein